MHGVVMVQSEFFQEQMRALTDQTKSIGESAMKAATGAFTPKGGASAAWTMAPLSLSLRFWVSHPI